MMRIRRKHRCIQANGLQWIAREYGKIDRNNKEGNTHERLYCKSNSSGRAGKEPLLRQQKELVETAREHHNTSPVATAALGRLLTAGAMMGSMMKNETDMLTLQVRGDGPLNWYHRYRRQ